MNYQDRREPDRNEPERVADRRPATPFAAAERGPASRLDQTPHLNGHAAGATNGAPRLAAERRPEPPPANNANNGSDPFWSRQDAWDNVERSLDKVVATTRQAPIVEPLRQPEANGRATSAPGKANSVQPSAHASSMASGMASGIAPGAVPPTFRRNEPASRPAPLASESEWAQGRVAPTQSRTPISPRPGLDDEDFWRDRGKPAAAAWPQGDDLDPDVDDALEIDRPAGRGWIVTIGWVLFAGIVAGLMAFVYLGRTNVVRTLPGAAPLYAKAGLPVNVRGLEFRNVSYKWGIDRKGRPAMTVAGTVINITNQPQSVPSVAFVFLDAAQAELFNWATPIRDTPLQPGKSTSFEARIPAPPDAVANLQLRFAKSR
jgi:hypothetical protein